GVILGNRHRLGVITRARGGRPIPWESGKSRGDRATHRTGRRGRPIPGESRTALGRRSPGSRSRSFPGNRLAPGWATGTTGGGGEGGGFPGNRDGPRRSCGATRGPPGTTDSWGIAHGSRSGITAESVEVIPGESGSLWGGGVGPRRALAGQLIP